MSSCVSEAVETLLDIAWDDLILHNASNTMAIDIFEIFIVKSSGILVELQIEKERKLNHFTQVKITNRMMTSA